MRGIPMAKKQIPVHVTSEQLEFLNAESRRLEISKADVIRRLLDKARGVQVGKD